MNFFDLKMDFSFSGSSSSYPSSCGARRGGIAQPVGDARLRQAKAALAAGLSVISFGAGSVFAQPKYGPGTSATEIKVGQTIAYSGPASAYGQLGKVEEAYFKWLNAKGGINGRKITFITLDDGTVPLAIDPAQFEVLWHGFGAQTPERALLLAMLERTAADLKNFRYARQRANQRLYMDAYLWVASDDITLHEVVEAAPAP